jgi:MerR family transcriptional regulator, light-induced transcriptional regulator
MLSIGELSVSTGVAAGTLRMWETRHGFPAPQRLESGHRRYATGDVELVRLVLREREAGLSLAPAIDRALAFAARGEPSVFAGLRRRRPEIRPQRLEKWALVSLSHAIEDEYLAGGGRGLLAGSFQRPAFYRASRRRWRELDRLAEASVVLAGFRSLRRPTAAPIEVPVGSADPAEREWAVICDAPGFTACLVGAEAADRGRSDRQRAFDVIWSFDPTTVRDAAELVIGIVAARAPRCEAVLRDAIEHRPGPGPTATALSACERMVGYLARPGRGG